MNQQQLLQQLEYDDALLGFYTICQQHGARRVLLDFRENFRDMFQEVVVQANRLGPEDRLPYLLK